MAVGEWGRRFLVVEIARNARKIKIEHTYETKKQAHRK